MITKEQFVKRIKFLKKFNDDMNEFDNALKKFAASDFTGFWDEQRFNVFLDTLKDDMNDQYDLISWWLFDTECGKRKEMCKIWEKDAKTTDRPIAIINTPEKLYDYIVESNNYDPQNNTSTIPLAIRTQTEGVKYAISEIQKIIDTNYKTKNKGWESREALLKLARDNIKNHYAIETGVIIGDNQIKNLTLLRKVENE